MTSDGPTTRTAIIHNHVHIHIYDDINYSPHSSMSIPHSAYDPRRVFRFNVPHFEIGPKARSVGTYLSGGLVCQSLVLGLQSLSFPDLLLT